MDNKTTTSRKIIPYLWLLPGFCLTIIANGTLATPAGSWLGMIFLIHFYRSQKRLSAVFMVSLLYIVANGISYWNAISIPVLARTGLLTGYLALFCLLFFIDYFVTKYIHGFLKTLALPLAAVILEYALTLFSPYAATGAYAYTQYDNYPLLQLVSVTGMWGVSFFMYWFFSIVPLFLEKPFSFTKYKKGVILFILITIVIYGFGSLRLRFFRPAAETVKIASLTIERRAPDALAQALTLTEREAGAGARIIFWQEAALLLQKESQAREALEQTARIAKQYNVYVFPAFVIQEKRFSPGINKVVCIDNQGVIQFEYQKSHEIPGGLSIEGPAELKTIATPYGTLSTAICYDADFPQFIRQASLKKVDILMVPSSDWKQIDPLHTRMIGLRAVENGISLIRQSYACLSMSFDYLGRTISSLDYFHTTDRVMISHVPTRRITTIYGILGDWLVWLCLAGFCGLMISVIITKTKQNKEKKS